MLDTYNASSMKMLEQSINTNEVLKYPGSTPEQDVYFIPGYLRVKCKNFISLDLQNLNGKVNVALIFDVYFGNLPNSIVEQLMTGIVLLFGRDDAEALVDKNDGLKVTVKRNNEQRLLKFTLRQNLNLRIQSDAFFTPFEIINLILSITVQPVKTKSMGTVKINLMEHTDRFLMNSYSQEGAFGMYNLAEKKMGSLYTNDRSCNTKQFYLSPDEKQKEFMEKIEHEKNSKDKKSGKIDHFQYAHFLVPLYRYPLDSLMSIFFPLWLLGIINLAIYFQQVSMGSRMGSLSTLMVAYVALIPVIRENIPPSPRIVFIEILVYLSALTIFFTLIESIAVRNQGADFEFIWSQSGWFIVSCIIIIASIVIISFMMLMHWTRWQPSYRMNIQDEQTVKFVREQWRSQSCDLYFQEIAQPISQNKIMVLPKSLNQIKSKKIL